MAVSDYSRKIVLHKLWSHEEKFKLMLWFEMRMIDESDDIKMRRPRRRLVSEYGRLHKTMYINT